MNRRQSSPSSCDIADSSSSHDSMPLTSDDFDVLNQLYTISFEKSKSKEAVWVLSSHPSLISLKLQVIQETVKEEGRMDAICMNLAIRKMSTEESHDPKSKYMPLFRKHYITTDFARYAISGGEGHSYLLTCIYNEFLGHYCAAYSEILCIPVDHNGHWGLYTFNMDDEKLSIFDPTGDHKTHDSIRSSLCNALQFVNEKFGLFKEKSDFRRWTHEYSTPGQCSSADSGFHVFNLMRHWDGRELARSFFPKESRELRKDFLAYILSFKDNESYELPSYVQKLIKILPAGPYNQEGPARIRYLMDETLMKVMREGNVGEFEKFLKGTSQMLNYGHVNDATKRSILWRGVTTDGDGILHIACRHRHERLVYSILEELIKDQCVSVNVASDDSQARSTGSQASQPAVGTAKLAAEFLRARNYKGETCLHEAVRWGHHNTKLVERLIDVDACLHNGRESPALVQIVDCEHVSPLYLAIILQCGDVVYRIIKGRRRYPEASYEGPEGQTALHAAVVLSKELSGQLLKWKADLIGKADKSGNTPLHLLASVGGKSTSMLLLPAPKRDEGEDGSTNSSLVQIDPEMVHEIVLKQDSKGWLPIHVAAANGMLDVIQQICSACLDSMSTRSASGQSFLHVAVEHKKSNVVAYACKQEALAGILNMRDRDGNTALHLAVKTGNQSVFCSLMSNREVYLSFANNDGHTPLDLAYSMYLEPGLQMLQNSWVLVYYHLRLAGGVFSIRRRDDVAAERMKKLQSGELSKTIGKSAGVMAVCAIFLLDIANSTFIQIATQYITPSNDNAAAAAAALSAAENGTRLQRIRANAFKALVFFNSLAFSSSIFAAFCGTFAGFPVMSLPTRFAYLWAGGVSLQVASLSVVAVFVLAAYLAFALVTLRMAATACVIPLVAITPHSSPLIFMLRHAWALFCRFIPPCYDVFLKCLNDCKGTSIAIGHTLKDILIPIGHTLKGIFHRLIHHVSIYFQQHPIPWIPHLRNAFLKCWNKCKGTFIAIGNTLKDILIPIGHTLKDILIAIGKALTYLIVMPLGCLGGILVILPVIAVAGAVAGIIALILFLFIGHPWA